MTADTPSADLPQLTITFLEQEMRVTVPDENQLAVLIAAQEWFRRQRRAFDILEPQLEALPPGTTDDHPLKVKAEALAQEGVKHIGRFQTILKSLFLDIGDWDFIQDGLADKTVRWQEVSDVPALIIEARNAAVAGEPVNRAARRAAKKTTGKLAK